jgi:hypothetical protein
MHAESIVRHGKFYLGERKGKRDTRWGRFLPGHGAEGHGEKRVPFYSSITIFLG